MRPIQSAVAFALITAIPMAALPAAAENLTAETHKLLKARNLDASIMSGLDKELAIPSAWIDGAKKEGKIRVRMTVSARNFTIMRKAFNARYPGIDIEYTRGIGQARAVGPLAAFRQGTIVVDVHSSFEAMQADYRRVNALIDISDLPAFKSIPSNMVAKGNVAASYKFTYWCLSYNTDRVKKSDLPKTWEELATSPRWQAGKVGMAINSHLWFAPLWGTYGDKWTDDYLQTVFKTMRPQLRKERLSAMSKLTALGEFDIGVPVGDFQVKNEAKKGAPVGFYCPDPAPVTSAWVGIMRGTPSLNASKVFTNWLLSKEGQIAVNVADNQTPAHKDLQLPVFLPYPDAVKGKKIAARDQAVFDKTGAIVGKFRKLWVSYGGPGGKKGKKK